MIFWHNLNHIMTRHGIPKLRIKVFMGDNTQANWNTMRIVYDSKNPKVLIKNRE